MGHLLVLTVMWMVAGGEMEAFAWTVFDPPISISTFHTVNIHFANLSIKLECQKAIDLITQLVG